jgi:Phosphodiester glycosidase
MRSRLGAVLAAALTLAVADGATAHASALPLGPSSLAETRQAVALAPGLTYTNIVRGTISPDQFYVVDVGFTLDPVAAEQTSARLRAEGYDANALAVDDHPPDQLAPGPTAYLARVGHYATAADARLAAAPITALGFTDVNVDWTGDDGTVTAGPWQVHILDIDPRRFRGTVANVLATGVVPSRETVSAIDARLGALATINGGYFVIGEGDGTPGDLAGISVLDGDLVSEAVNGRSALVLPHPDSSGARVRALSSSLAAASSDGSRREIDGRNRKAGLIRACGGVGGDLPTQSPLHDITCTDPSELIQFTPAFGATSDPTSEVEAALNGRGRVIALRPGGGPIPPDGSVLAGTGDGADWLRAHARPGVRVRVHVSVTEDRRGTELPRSPRLGVVNGGPRLLDAGVQVIDAVTEGFTHPGDPEWYYRFGVRRNPRTVAGVTSAGHLLLVAVDGRAPGYSDGLSFPEEAEVMRALGARDALNLDGGGSTTMALGTTLVTRPSDATGERPVGDAIAILPASHHRLRAAHGP